MMRSAPCRERKFRFMKKIFIAVFALLPFFCFAQAGGRTAATRTADAHSTDAAKWAKARDYLSCRLSLEAIRGKVRTDTSIRARFARVEPVLAAATIDAPPSAVVLDGTLRDFARVRQVVVDPIAQVDVGRLASTADGVRRLLDTAFAIVGQGYVIDEGAKAQLRSVVSKFLVADTQAKVAVTPAAKPVISLGGQPDGQTAASASAPRRGFDFWVLLPILLLGGVCLVLRQKYLEIKDELKARKVEMRSFNENYFSAGGPGARAAGGGSGASGAGAGSDRKAIERAIADSNVIAELNQAIGRLQLRISQLEGKGGAPAAGSGSGGYGGAGGSGAAGGSAAPGSYGSAGAGAVPSGAAAAGAVASGATAGTSGSVAPMTMKEKNKLKVVEPSKPTDADVFYMAGPVNNYFPNSAKSFTKDNTVYRFKVSPNKQDAEFELHTSGAPINEIVQLAESYIKSACDEENLPSYPVKNIITKKPGQAILEGDKWIIKSKALIRYE